MSNLFANLPSRGDEESFDTLASSDAVRIERIVSHGHVSPAEGWYDQSQDEFVVLLRGAARLEFEDGESKELVPGDWLAIPAHRRHRVAWTDPEAASVWLAVHYGSSDGA